LIKTGSEQKYLDKVLRGSLVAMRRFNNRKDVFSSPGFRANFLQVIIRGSCSATFVAKHWHDEADERPTVKEEVFPT
jgi:hypothetical protein